MLFKTRASPGGTATGGDVNLSGGYSDTATIVSGDNGNVSRSGGSFWGIGVRGRTGAGGFDGPDYGVGGGGAGSLDAANNFAGGDGEDGVVIVEEYF